MADWKKGEGKKEINVVKAQKEMVFCSLHHHTTFSYKDGYGTPEDHDVRAAEMGMPFLCLTEHGNVTSHVQHEQAARKVGVKPGFGVELYTGDVSEEGRTQRKNHLTVIAENQEGYKNLLRIVSRAWAEGFYYEPTASGEMLRDHAEGLIVLSGCSGSLLATSMIGGKNIDPADASLDRARKTADRMRSVLGDGYYLEVQAFPELEKTRNINQGLEILGDELNIPLVATLDAHYTQPTDGEVQMILHNLRPGKKVTIEEQAQSWGYDVPLTFLSDKVLYQRLVGTGLSKKAAEQAIRNSRVIAERCNVEIPKVDNLVYPLPPDADSPEVLLRRWMNDGWQYRRINSKPQVLDYQGRTYMERAKYELDLVIQKGFGDYFLFVSDAVRFAKDNNIPVGPARGSAAASLVCYLLRITEVDPMLFPNLLFERFIDLNRHDLPDIDIDFDDEYRWMVQEYLENKYGKDRVGNIGTFVRFKGKNSLDDVARVFQIPEEAVKTVKGLLIERASGDLRANATIEDTIEMFPQVKEIFDKYPDLYKSGLLEGNVKGMSVHAAGLVVANGPLSDFCAVYTKTDEDTGEVIQVVSLDKHDAEYLNVMKLDALGLKTMGMIRIALEEIGMTLEELYAIPLDDPGTIQGFKEGDVVGVFQFDGRAMRSVNQGVIPDNFAEVSDINALARPGPLHSGATAEYIDVKHGRKTATHWHPIIDGITEHTQGQIVYQEQILRVCRELGNFDWAEAAEIRKIISKKRGEQEFNQKRDKFVIGAKEHGLDKDTANKVFSMLATAGAYAFNAAHCVSYGMLAYWTMWLKRNHPTAFYVASLRKVGNDKKAKQKQLDLLKDLERYDRGIHVLPLHMNKSDRSWKADEGGIRPGFVQVRGIGDKMSAKILEKRQELGEFMGWEDLLEIHGIGDAKVDALISFIDDADPFGVQLLTDTLTKIRAELEEGIPDVGGFFMLPRPTHTAEDIPYDRTERNVEVVWLGVVKDRNLKDLFENYHSRTGKHLDRSTVKSPHLNEWVVMLCEDETDVLTVTVDRWKYRKFKERVWDINPSHDLVLFRGIKKYDQARRAIYVTDMWVIDPEDEEEASGQAVDGSEVPRVQAG